MVKEDYFYANIDGKTIDFIVLPNGHISCDECQAVWCDHIQRVVKDHLDAHVIWNTEDGAEYSDHLPMQVPMFPTLGLWTKVDLALMVDPRVTKYSVEWAHPTTKNFVNLGSLSNGEGRSVVRGLLLEYMYANHSLERQCAMPSHGFQEEMHYKSRLASRMAAAEYWCIFMNDHCVACETKLMNFTNGDDDLIPGKESTGVWNPYA